MVMAPIKEERCDWPGLGSCQLSVGFLCDPIAQIARKGGAAKFRPFPTFVEDFATGPSSFPSILEQKCFGYVHAPMESDLTLAKNSSQTLEATYVTAVFDVLGKVCAVEARITAAHRMP
jgi:hypothetical protein